MATTYEFFEPFTSILGRGANLPSDTLKLALMATGWTPTASNGVWADISASELAAGSGYLAGGYTLTTVTYNQVGGVVTFTSDFAEWTAAGGSIGPSPYAVIYLQGTIDGLVNPLFAAISLDGDKTAPDTNTFRVRPNASGWYTGTPTNG